MRELRHENVNPFIGCFIDPLRPSLVMEHCTRKSLEVSSSAVWSCNVCWISSGLTWDGTHVTKWQFTIQQVSALNSWVAGSSQPVKQNKRPFPKNKLHGARGDLRNQKASDQNTATQTQWPKHSDLETVTWTLRPKHSDPNTNKQMYKWSISINFIAIYISENIRKLSIHWNLSPNCTSSLPKSLPNVYFEYFPKSQICTQTLASPKIRK